ncbi:hypothetical protein BDV29DRAFT_59736 [Aspergillus leporis]|uniref:Protein kinase domain-containing protein n=1 Tax=Aspergillus leporis TaxID=41062 RepID=A0A5N5WKG7_9EURO|nr:hypothetical protein BDV29DRAFT_59736 [Aspergillus leporis]
MSGTSDKHLTCLDFESFQAQEASQSESHLSKCRPDEAENPHQSLKNSQSKGLNKRHASPTTERAGKIIKGSPKGFGLPQVIEHADTRRALIVRNESPWDTFQKHFSCQLLAGTVIIAAHRSRPTKVIAIREYPAEIAEKMLQCFHHIQHENILSATECYRDRDSLYTVVDDIPLTLEHLNSSRNLCPTQLQLGSILKQVLDGLSYLVANGFEHRSLTCSNTLLALDGSIKIAGLESCIESPQSKSQTLSIKAIATMTMDLMQTYEKDNGVVGVDDLDLWPVDSDAFSFLSTTSSAGSIEALKQHPLINRPPRHRGQLVCLARLAIISARTFYSLEL